MIPTTPSPYTLSALVPGVLNRLEENADIGTPPPVFWSQQNEVYSALVEAVNDLTLLVGRPVQTVRASIPLQPNSVWQAVPRGILLITDIYGQSGIIRKTDLHSMDYVQTNWTSGWEQDVDTTGYGPQRWLPLGLTLFAVHPAPSVEMTVTVNAIPYPVQEAWPYQGTESVPFQDEFFAALEEYAAMTLRLKEGGAEFTEATGMYNSYLKLAARMTEIQGRQDPLIFSPVTGGPVKLNAITSR